ncbi:MAG: ferrous iron transport protein B [Clostridiaceae bacterium]|nr:ferrous iron transport protein B [Clostridiaceae bacterium]
MRFALAGNPNCGKTTLFNELTGSTAHVGNWPGVTVDRKEGTYKKLKEKVTIIDLPGIYSLSPYTPEEVVTRNYIVDENPDLIINIIDATNLERNLYLTTQILETNCPVVIALNMMDSVQKNGTKIDVHSLENALGVPVIPISALRREGIEKLMQRAYECSRKKRIGKSVLEDSEMKIEYKKIVDMLSSENVLHSSFHAVKLLEDDEIEKKELSKYLPKVQELKSEIKLKEELDGDFEAAIADIRYKYITKHYQGAIRRSQSVHELTRSDKIDKVLTNKWLGIPIFLLCMFLVFHLTFSKDLLFLNKFGIVEEGINCPAIWLQGILGDAFDALKDTVSNGLISVGASDWISGLVVDGVISGVSSVLSFLPQILSLFLFLSIMEDSGYMARAAFLMDRLLRKFGLSGKAFMPLLMCFGCMVPGAMATRTIEDEKERRITVMLAPFFSCGAKLPIWAMFAGALFERHADTVVFGVYLLGIVTAIITAIILKKFVFKGETSAFIMELPAYHLPQVKSIILLLWEKLKGFISRAATIIAGATVIIWFLSNFSFSFEMVDANSADSILGVIGTFLRPLFIPLGFASGEIGWKAVVAIITGLIAKEMVVSTLGVLYNPDVEGDAKEDDDAGAALAATLAVTFSPAAALSFMAFNLLSVPCMAAVAAAHGELRSKKKTLVTIGFWILTAWVVSFLVFNIATLCGLGA